MSLLETLGLNIFSSFLYDRLKKFKDLKNKSEAQKISERLRLVLKLMNDARDEKFTIAEFSRILGLHKVSDLEKYFLAEEEPTFDFLNLFCNQFAINIEWLVEGKDQPFKYDEDHYIHLFDDCLKKIENLNPKVVYFVRADSISGETCLVLKTDEYRTIVLNTYVHFSAINGHGGMCQLIDLRKLIMSLILEKNMITKSLIVSKDIFFDLFNGKIHPSLALQKRKGSFQYWHDDFTDIYNQRCGYERHKEYDQNFQDAFNLVKSAIEKQSKN